MDTEVTVYAYFTSTSDDNRVVRMTYDGTRLSKATPVLTGIPAAGNHNGGLVTIGPDDKLWIGTGEGGQPPRSQDRENLGGKILRLDLDGSIPDDNPFPGSPVYSLGHRNVQGLAFDSQDRPWAVEFGQNTWDELNRIEAGGNYGWPEVEGKQAAEGFIAPLVQWSTDEASPSGMAIVDDVAYIGGLRGERLWQVPLTGTTTGPAKAYLKGEFGRIRNVVAAPGGRCGSRPPTGTGAATRATATTRSSDSTCPRADQPRVRATALVETSAAQGVSLEEGAAVSRNTFISRSPTMSG